MIGIPSIVVLSVRAVLLGALGYEVEDDLPVCRVLVLELIMVVDPAEARLQEETCGQ
jgi:hypothetical protein